MKPVKILTGLLVAFQLYAVEYALPKWLAGEPGLSAPIVCKPCLEPPNPGFLKALKTNPGFPKTVAYSENMLNLPMPDISEDTMDDLLKDYYRTWTRRYYYTAIYTPFSMRFKVFAQGYLLTGDARYVRKTEEVIKKYCALKSWALPGTMERRGVTNGVDLISTESARNLSLALAVMKKEMDPAVYAMAHKELLIRIIEPTEQAFCKERPPFEFLRSQSNRNAVCNDNLIRVAAWTLWNEPKRMTKFIDCCLRSLNYSLKPFAADGYCDEGCGYWNYGLDHYLDATLFVYVMTGGKQNLLDLPTAQNSLYYPYKIRMAKTLTPAFSDSGVNTPPSRDVLQKINFMLGKQSKAEKLRTWDDVSDCMLYYLAKQPKKKNLTIDAGDTRVSTFPVAGVAVCRPLNTASRMSVAWKGGNNHEKRNHNDVGSFVVGVGDIPLLCDPGTPDYTTDTSRKRYDSLFYNSFGHSVPQVDGKLQVEGTQTNAKLLKEIRKPDFFSWELDILPCYRVDGVKTLVRTFSYDWTGPVTFTVSDRVKSERPIDFETALTSPGRFKETAPGMLEVGCFKRTLLIKIDTGNVPYELHKTVLKEHKIKEMNAYPTRLGIRLKEKVTDAHITLTITEKPKK